jgi:hypothetical protein
MEPNGTECGAKGNGLKKFESKKRGYPRENEGQIRRKCAKSEMNTRAIKCKGGSRRILQVIKRDI